MKTLTNSNSCGFTLTEVIIAIGVLTLLLTGFISVFTPAAQGIRRSLSAEQAERLTGGLEQELVTVRSGQSPIVTSGFDKAFAWIAQATTPENALIVYQYRGSAGSLRADGTPTPTTTTGTPGVDYVVQTMVRRPNDSNLAADFAALEGAVFYVKTKQLIQSSDGLIEGTAGEIKNADETPAADSASYTEAVIAFKADFYQLPQKTTAYLTGDSFKALFNGTNAKLVFSRNLAVRR